MAIGHLPPEPFASHIDVLTAAQALEVAIHAAGAGEAAMAIDQALTQVYNAWKYLQDGGYADLAGSTSEVWHALNSLRAQVVSLPNDRLRAFLGGPLYGFQGTLRWLDQQLIALG